ncbi:MAG: DUF881 domain-containing protein [Candidatus Nanopelagicales bacterium]
MSKRTNIQDSSLLLEKLWQDVQDDSYFKKAERKKNLGKSTSDPRWLILIVLTIAGIIFGIGASITRQSIPISLQNRDLLRENITTQSILLEEKETKLEEVTQKITSLQESQASVLPSVDQDELALLNFASGYQAAIGPGLEIELNDADLTKISLDIDPSLARVFDTDIFTVLNGLWTAGAEAIAIGNQRISPMTAVSQSGEAILVNYRPILPPYKIYAIGPSDLLENFLKTEDFKQIDEVSRIYNIGLKVTPLDSIELPTSVRVLPEVENLRIGNIN